MSDPDLTAKADQAVAALKDILGERTDGFVLLFEVDGRGVVVAFDLPESVSLSDFLKRGARAARQRGE